MDMFKILRYLVKLIKLYGEFADHDFEEIQIDQLDDKDFFLLIVTLRPKKDV